ncbi:MAG: GIY-YIG nuclease family protein [Alphaproteobacteria bacterium]|nr:GIY-YIG nuclease family protein [Alphaproteobacteria bacterium]
MHYVYLIRSQSDPEQIYVGATFDLKQRLSDHNDGKSLHTSKYTPWKLVCYVAVQDKYRAMELEKYLKSHSGRAFVAKHLW